MADSVTISGTAPEASFTKGQLAFYLLSVFTSQVANNANIVMLPLAMYKFATPPVAAIPASLTNLSDGLGTIFGGWLISILSPKFALILSFGVRAMCLTGTALMIWLHIGADPDVHTPGYEFWILALVYNVDAVFRGVVDTIRSTIPLLLGGRSKSMLDDLNAKTMIAFEFGVLLGPLMTSILMSLKSHGPSQITTTFSMAMTVGPILMVVAALVACRVPHVEKQHRGGGSSANPFRSFWAVLRNPWLRYTLLGTLMLQCHRLKGILPQVFCVYLLHDERYSGFLVAVYGLGGILGSMTFKRLSKRWEAWMFPFLSAAGIFVIAWGWLPAYFERDNLVDTGIEVMKLVVFGITIFIFNTPNVMSRLALRRIYQQHAPQHIRGGVIAMNRFSAEVSGFVFKLLVGSVALMPAITPKPDNTKPVPESTFTAFTLCAIFLMLAGIIQIGVALWLRQAKRKEKASRTAENERSPLVPFSSEEPEESTPTPKKDYTYAEEPGQKEAEGAVV